jgi:NitT/TauT family transport system substrate-binding protein
MRCLAGLFATIALAVAPVAAGIAEPLKVVVVSRGIWEPSVHEFGLRAGLFQKHGVELELLHTQGTGEQLQAVLAGSVDLATGLGVLSLMGAVAKGAPLVLVGSSLTGSTDVFLYVPQNSPVKTFKDVEGKTIGVTGTGSSSHLAALALLDFHKVNAKTLVVGGIPTIYTNVMSGQIDIGISSVPFYLSAAEAGTIRVVARAADVPALRGQTVRGMVATRATLDKKRPVLTRYVEAYNEARAAMYDDPKALAWYGEAHGLSVEQVRRALHAYLPREATQTGVAKGIALSIEQAKQFKFVPSDFTTQQMAAHIDLLVGQ